MTSLTGIDPFLEHSNVVGRNIRLLKETVFEHDGEYDVVMLHHSFEHMSDPVQVMRRLSELISPDGAILIRVPVADSFAWRHYGVDWVHLDPPRHLFIHTRKSMARLATLTDLKLIHVESDSHEFQFTGSELVRRGIAVSQQSTTTACTQAELAAYRTRTDALNLDDEGDQAVFILTKSRNQQGRAAP